MRRGLWMVIIMVIIAGHELFQPAEAVILENFMTPGPVIKGHAKWENRCEKCHKAFSKEAQQELCLDCHKEEARDYRQKKGYHGLNPEILNTNCRECHTDHKGRDARIVLIDKDVFPHQFTDFPLAGPHALAACDACHRPDEKYRETPHKCFDCHKKQDVHKESLGKKCEDCHEQSSWTKSRYDHSKTKFALKEKHLKVACTACHPKQRWKNIPTDCYSCHVLNDVHQSRYGRKCEDCHTHKEWKRSTYDHDKTKFPLKEKHRKISCDLCHPGDIYKDKLKLDCASCHGKIDVHQKRYGEKCQDCHTEKTWTKSKYDHAKTKFPLKGKHEKVDCDRCHKGVLDKENLSLECFPCHKFDDIHAGKEETKCQRCHSPEGWRVKVVFDHDVTRFPLIGLHAIVPCEECHPGSRYRKTPVECVRCHESKDDHKGKLGKPCVPCHNPNGWNVWRFSHDDDTDFDLTGKHKKLKCDACHREPVKDKIDMSMECGSCHRGDDVHRGGFGQACSRCHGTENFYDVKPGP